MSEANLKLIDVDRQYGDGEGALRVLQKANLEVMPGEMVALVAPSGAGKSTLLHVSGLLERSQGGDVVICGQSCAQMPDRARTEMRRHTVGYVYQFHHLLPEFSALENVVMPQLIAGQAKGDAETHALELLDLLGVRDRAEHRPGELSGGEQQRVAIARAAANHPKVILADEPTGNLDPATSDRVFAALMDLIAERQAAALIATHNHELARRANRIVTLHQGQVIPVQL